VRIQRRHFRLTVKRNTVRTVLPLNDFTKSAKTEACLANSLAELKAEEGDNFNVADWPLYMESLNGPRRMETIWNGLAKRKLSEDQIEKVMGQNLRRLYAEVF